MDQHNQIQSNQQAQPVLLVQSPMAQVDDGISITDVLVVFLRKIKWFVLLWFLCFFVSFLTIFWQNQKVVYKQRVVLPTVMNTATLQRQLLFSSSDLLGQFYAQYVMYWQNDPRLFINKSFQYTAAAAKDSDGTGANVPEDSLMLSITAPITSQSDVENLFAMSVSSLQQIVDIKCKDWQSAMQAQMTNDQSLVKSLQAALSQTPATTDRASGGLSQSQMQDELIQAKRKLAEDKWLMSTAKAQVKLVGPLYVSKTESLLMVLIQSLVVTTIVALVIMFMVCAMIVGFKQQARQRS